MAPDEPFVHHADMTAREKALREQVFSGESRQRTIFDDPNPAIAPMGEAYGLPCRVDLA